MEHVVVLRGVAEQDLGEFYAHREANHMAAPRRVEPADRTAFLERWHGIMDDPKGKVRTIIADGQVVGYIAHFKRNEQPEVSYELGRKYWGNGFATEALQQFLKEVTVRPLYARAAKDNMGSIRVLQKCGFSIVGEDRFVARQGHEVEEFVFALADPRSG